MTLVFDRIRGSLRSRRVDATAFSSPVYLALFSALALAGCGSGSTTSSPTTAAAVVTSPGTPSSPSTPASPVSNPLATTDQRDLDAQAISINQANQFEPVRTEARLAYIAARGELPSQEALSRLDNAMAELAFSAVQKVVNGDVYRPKVYWVNAQPRDWFGLSVPGSRYSYDNPDNIYRIIPIDGGLRYEIHGQRFTPGPSDVSFSLINNASSQGTIAFIDGRDLVLNSDGSYVVSVDSDPANGRVNHMQSTSKAVQLFVRNNLGDWLHETPDQLSVARVDTTTAAAVPTTQTITTNAYGALQDAVLYYGVGALGVKTSVNPVNTLPAPSQSATLGTLVSQANSFGHFKLADGEALLIHLNRGGAGYFVVPVTDPWMITVDPAQHQSSLNQSQSVADTDGNYTFVVSPTDPGLSNWLDTVGLHEGTIMVRWQGLPTTTVNGGPNVSASVVKIADLPTLLPAAARVTAAQRATQLSNRYQGYLRRISFPAAQ